MPKFYCVHETRMRVHQALHPYAATWIQSKINYSLFPIKAVWLGIWIIVSLTLHAASASGINDTGITTCSNATQNNLSCPMVGFPRQDAEYGTNGFNFTKLDTVGNRLPATATNHTCVQDNVTGLVWEVKTNDGGLRDKGNTYNFDQASTFATTVNSAGGLCGFTDWRVPNPQELVGLINFSMSSNLIIDTNYFPNSLGIGFWTNSTYVGDSSNAWYILFNNGTIGYFSRNNKLAVRLVHGIQSVPALHDNGDSTITDANTGLTWAKCAEGLSGSGCTLGNTSSFSWDQALTVAANSTLAGHNDWRLPNIKELQSMVYYGSYNPSVNIAYFPNTPANWFWSSSPYAYFSNGSWYANFRDGYTYEGNRIRNVAIRLVRGGQSLVTYTVTPITNQYGTVNPNSAQIVTAGTTQNFVVTPKVGYIKSPKGVTGSCPKGSWNANIYTTGAITANCSVNFNFFCLACIPEITGWRDIIKR